MKCQGSTLASLVALTTALSSLPGAEAAPVPVSFAEGAAHGYLALGSENGETIAQGELLQTVRDERVESRLVFHFKDGSLYEEKVTFSQQRVFTVLSYQLSQRGPSFPHDLLISMDRRTGAYQVRSRAGADDPEEVTTGRLEWPPDVYNGIIGTLLKNLPRGKTETVHFVVFTPKPKLIKLELRPEADDTVRVGDLSKSATRYVLKPHLSVLVHFFGKLLRRLPATFHYRFWILNDGVPAFARFEGPLYLMGPIWRVELLSPRLPAMPRDKARS